MKNRKVVIFNGILYSFLNKLGSQIEYKHQVYFEANQLFTSVQNIFLVVITHCFPPFIVILEYNLEEIVLKGEIRKK